MLARGHRLQVGSGSMIGWSIANALARVASEVGEDAVRLATRELPDTRSEAALPLRSRGRVFGALTVQSSVPDAFDEAIIIVLQTMADQVAAALDNARLFAGSQAALEAMRRTSVELSRQAWAELLQARPDMGYRSAEGVATHTTDIWRPEMEQAVQKGQTIRLDGTGDGTTLPLAVPVKVRGNVIGVLDTYKPEGRDWTSEEIAALETLADQLGAALEGARLYQDTQRRAAREQILREVTARVRSSTDPETVLRSLLREVGTVLGRSAFVRMVTPESGNTERPTPAPVTQPDRGNGDQPSVQGGK
jgi:GAF domain-containing protein